MRIVVCADGTESTDASNDSTGISESVLCMCRLRRRREHTVHEAGIIAPRIAGRKDARRTVVWIDNTELIARGLLHCIGKQDRHGTRADGLAYLVECGTWGRPWVSCDSSTHVASRVDPYS